MNVYFEIFHYDKRHKLKYKTESEQSKSFVKAFLQFLYVLTSNLTQDIIDITNTSRTVSSATLARSGVTSPGLDSKNDFIVMPESTTDTVSIFSDDAGIVVGTSATAVAVADDNLVAQIEHGTSAGQFVHYGCWGLNYATGATAASFDIERIFRNSSGGTIVVAEIGIYAGSCLSSNGRAFCFVRDVLGATITVLDGEYLKVKYTIQVSN